MKATAAPPFDISQSKRFILIPTPDLRRLLFALTRREKRGGSRRGENEIMGTQCDEIDTQRHDSMEQLL